MKLSYVACALACLGCGKIEEDKSEGVMGSGGTPPLAGEDDEMEDPEPPRPEYEMTAPCEESLSRQDVPLIRQRALSNLHHALFGSPATDEFIDSAPSELTPEVLLGLIDVGFQDPRAEAALGSFFLRWVGDRGALSVEKDQGLYPDYVDELYPQMREEARKTGFSTLLDDTGQRSLKWLLTSNESLVSEDLASFYGTPVDGEGWGEVPGRVGLFSTGLFSALNAFSDYTRPVARGLVIREQLLCGQLPPPPPDLDFSQPAVFPPSEDSRAYWEEEVLAEPVCRNCHQLFTAIGVGFEEYDAVGRFRERADEDLYTSTALVTQLDVAPGEREFDSPEAMFAELAYLTQVNRCFSRRWVAYLFGRGSLSQPLVDAAENARNCAIQNEDVFSVRNLVTELLLSPEFLNSHECGSQHCLGGVEDCVVHGPELSECLPTGEVPQLADCETQLLEGGETLFDCSAL